MKLLDIEPVNVPSAPDVTKPYTAFARLAEVAGEGFRAIGNELIRTQQQKAMVELATGMNDLEQEIEANKFVSTSWVKERVDIDSLPPEIRGQLFHRGLDIPTGETIETDRDDIPVWMIADSVFDAQAKKMISSSSRHITAGRVEEFQRMAEMDALGRKSKINRRQMESMHAFFVEEQTQSAIELANAGDFEGARDVVSRSRSMDPVYKEKVLGEVEKVEQTKPVLDALRTDDYGAMAEFVGKLNNPKEFTKLTPAERDAYAGRLKAEIKQFQKAVKEDTDRVFEANAQAGWNGIFEKVRAGQMPSYKDIPPPGTIKADEQKQMIEYVDNKRKGKDPETNLSLYSMLSDLARTQPEKFVEYPIMKHVNELSPTDLKHFVDLKAGKAGAGPAYDNFVTTDEAINSRLVGRGIDLRDKDEEVQSGIGNVKAVIQHELSALGRRATLEERDAIIDRVIEEKASIDDPWWRGPSVKFQNTNIPARYEVAIRRVYSYLARQNPQLDSRITQQNLAGVWKDFSTFERQITDSWPFYAKGKKLTPEDAMLVYGVLKSAGSTIDAELNRAGAALTPENRAALAVQMFFQPKR